MKLYRMTPKQDSRADRAAVYASRSRFIPDSILGSFETRSWRDQTDSQIEAAGRPMPCRSLKLAKTFPPGKERDVSLQMAQVWQRLSDQYINSTSPLFQAAQQQQQIQPTDEDKDREES
jgi:hypothetical protein